MGLFDNVFGGLGASSKPFGPAEGFAGILVGAVCSDGHISREEVAGLWTVLERMRLYDNWTADKFNAMMDRILGLFKREGLEALLNKCASSVPEELRETAFANACDLVLADGVVEDSEKEFLDDLQRYLQIPGDQALTIVEVMVVKNRG